MSLTNILTVSTEEERAFYEGKEQIQKSKAFLPLSLSKDFLKS